MKAIERRGISADVFQSTQHFLQRVGWAQDRYTVLSWLFSELTPPVPFAIRSQTA